nr:hypothetical protein Iba_chr12fCG6550 [Ipomoea batatas]
MLAVNVRRLMRFLGHSNGLSIMSWVWLRGIYKVGILSLGAIDYWMANDASAMLRMILLLFGVYDSDEFFYNTEDRLVLEQRQILKGNIYTGSNGGLDSDRWPGETRLHEDMSMCDLWTHRQIYASIWYKRTVVRILLGTDGNDVSNTDCSQIKG